MNRLFCWPMLLCVFLAPLAPAGDAKSDAKKLLGTWKPVAAEFAGKPLPEKVVTSVTLVMADGKYTATVGDKTNEGTWKHDPTKKPATMDITSTEGPKAGQTLLATYELKGDTLRVCYDVSGKTRPKELKTAPETTLYLVEYKRQKR